MKNGNVSLFVLLLMTSAALAEAQTKKDAAPAKVDTVNGQTQSIEVKKEAAPKTEAPAQTEEAQAKTESAAQGQTEPMPAKTDEEGKLISVPGSKSLGMSILGNQEAPTALVLVPWKTSELGNGPGVSTMLDDSRQPIDKDVFMRMLSYYEIRSGPAQPAGSPINSNAAQSTAAQRRKQ